MHNKRTQMLSSSFATSIRWRLCERQSLGGRPTAADRILGPLVLRVEEVVEQAGARLVLQDGLKLGLWQRNQLLEVRHFVHD